MRETVKSMRAYFFLVGLFAVGSNIAGMAQPDVPMVAKIIFAISMVIGVAFFYAAFTLKSAIEKGKIGAIQAVILINLVWGIAIGGLSLLSEQSPGIICQLVGTIVICLYLLFNLRRLASNAKTPTVQSGQE